MGSQSISCRYISQLCWWMCHGKLSAGGRTHAKCPKQTNTHTFCIHLTTHTHMRISSVQLGSSLRQTRANAIAVILCMRSACDRLSLFRSVEQYRCRYWVWSGIHTVPQHASYVRMSCWRFMVAPSSCIYVHTARSGYDTLQNIFMCTL